MKQVTPKVRLIAKPQIDWDEVADYLESVGGRAWYDRKAAYYDSQAPYSNEAINDGESLVEFGGRLCYRSWDVGLNPNVTRIREDSDDYLENILRSLHGSVIAHAWYSFVMQDVSRVFTHEMVRHRAGTEFSQESMRFVRLTEIPFWFPDWAKADDGLMVQCLDVLDRLEDHQTWMADHFGLNDPGVPFSEKKAKTSFMRRFAPDGVATSILVTINIRAIRWVLQQRTEPGAEEEIRLVFDQVGHIMVNEAPALFTDFKRNDDGSWVPDYRKV
jgi:thymidylate synthase (FAD)